MATRRVIEDSDDEGSDFSPPRSPAYSLLTDVADRDDHDHRVPDEYAAAGPSTLDGLDGAQQASRSGSTDPAFFERVYQEQSRTVEPLDRATTIPQTVALGVSLSNDAGSTDRQPETRSSITDPTTGSRGKRRTSGPAAAADLTQVTTPGRPSRKAANAAVWDVPSSPATVGKRSSSKAVMTYGKRKHAHASAGFATSSLSSPVAKRPRAAVQAGPRSPGAQLADELDLGGNSRAAAAAAAVRGTESSHAGAGDDVDLVVIPRSGDRVRPSGAGSDATSAPGQTQIRETQNATIEVTLPQTLSSSQKQAYKVFSLSSEPSPEDDGSPLPKRIDYSVHKSSGITVAVSTPSHFASSRKVDGSELPSTAEVPPPPSTNKRGRKRKSNPVPTSSPDIFAEVENTRASKKPKKFVYYDDSWEPKGAREDVEEYAPRSSRTRLAVATEGLPDTQLPGALPDTQPFGTLPDTQPPGVLQAREMPGRLPDTLPPPPPPPPEFANQITEQNRPQDELTLDLPDYNRGRSADPILIMSSDQEAGPSRVPEKQAKPQKKRGRKKKEVAKPPEPPAAPAEPAAGDDVTHAFSAMQQTDASTEIYEKTDAAHVPALEIPVVEAPPKKKRGRPKADTTTQEVDQTPVVGAEAPKKKRGRPKKSAAKVTEPTAKEEVAKESGHATALSPPTDAADPAATRALSQVSDGNSQTKTCRASVESPEGANVSGGRKASAGVAGKGMENDDLDGGSKSSAVATPAKDVSRETAAAAAVAATVAKAGTTNGCSPAGQAGKVSYRVGLSRRSRIAPLLKSLRK
ncbi:hypothetical protein RB595_005259 [Gaeumannomyces hyphopodioides]